MRWEIYEKKFRIEAEKKKASVEKIEGWLDYARKISVQNLPIIYDQTHLSLIIGIDDGYLHSMSNAPEYFYRTFYIKKRNGKLRRIDEPLPDLKKVQSWILSEILYKIPCSKYAKAYIPNTSIKDNVRFHKKQKTVVTIDVSNFFPSIKSGYVLATFLGMGYSMQVSVLLTSIASQK